ncbi:MAG TPA: DUF1800 family protein [Oligoflexia bacterium]|nr:DUF1800 family protein [Oligoflexia bacterium]
MFIFSIAFLNLSLATSIYAESTFYPATGLYNGFLNQINIVECDNAGEYPLSPTLSVYSSSGSLISALPMNISAGGTQHIILNDLFNIKDTYGTFRIDVPESENLKSDRLICRTAFYRSAVNHDEKPYDFAYSLPVKNPDSGDRAGSFNSFNPSGSPEPTFNWLSIVNLDSRDFSGELRLFNSLGENIGSREISSLSPSSRIDIALGHDIGQVVGSYVVLPSDKSLKYQAFVIRYGVTDSQFRFAFPLQAVAGSCSGNLVQLSTMGSDKTVNWLEVVNLNKMAIPVKIIIRDRFGSELQTNEVLLSPLAQYHLYANEIIDPAGTGNVGSAQVVCNDPTDRLITQSLYYGRTSALKTEWAYASQDNQYSVNGKGAKLVAPVNTFLGMFNWLKLSSSNQVSPVEYSLFNNSGQNVSSGEFYLGSNTTADIGVHAEFPSDSIGTAVVSSQTLDGQFSGELLRIVQKRSGGIGTIMQIPGIVQSSGVSGLSSSGSDGVSSFIGNSQSLSKYRDRLTREEAFHLLTRVGFGASPEEVSNAQKDGLDATVSRLMNFTEDSELDALSTRWLDDNFNEDIGMMKLAGIQKYLLYNMIYTKNPLRERMTLIWHDLFATSCNVVNDDRIANSCYNHLKLLQDNSLGNFRTLAKELTIDFVMLRWLNGNANRRGTPDENYSREFWELFTLGEWSKHLGRYKLYSSKDISEAARAFTGWTTPVPAEQDPNLKAVFVLSRFDTGRKTIFENTPYEVSGAFGYSDLIDHTLARPEAAEWVVKRLYSAFVHDHPSPSVVNELRDLLISSNYETAPVIRKLLTSSALFSADSYKARVKDGATFGIGFIRTVKIPVDVSNVYGRFNGNGLGYQPLFPPSVNGWLLNKYQGANLTEFFLGWSTEYVNFIREILFRAETVKPDFNYSQLIPFEVSTIEQVQQSAERLVDYWSGALGVRLSDYERNTLINYMHSQRNVNGTVSLSPFDPGNPERVRQKIPGLLWLLSQHEDYRTF